MSYDPELAVRIVKNAECARRYRLLHAVECSPFVIQYGRKRDPLYGFARISLYIPSRRKSIVGSVMFNPEAPKSFVRGDLLKRMAYGLAHEMVRPEEIPVKR